MPELLLMLLAAGDTFGTVVICGFIIPGLWLYSHRTGRTSKEPPALVRRIFRNAKRWYWAAVVVQMLARSLDGDGVSFFEGLHLVICWLCWRDMKDLDDDDTWKRLKDKVTDVVKQVGDRLVIAPPEPATAGA